MEQQTKRQIMIRLLSIIQATRTLQQEVSPSLAIISRVLLQQQNLSMHATLPSACATAQQAARAQTALNAVVRRFRTGLRVIQQVFQRLSQQQTLPQATTASTI